MFLGGCSVYDFKTAVAVVKYRNSCRMSDRTLTDTQSRNCNDTASLTVSLSLVASINSHTAFGQSHIIINYYSSLFIPKNCWFEPFKVHCIKCIVTYTSFFLLGHRLIALWCQLHASLLSSRSFCPVLAYQLSPCTSILHPSLTV